MVTRHTVSHADELYRGDAKNRGSANADARRGVQFSHMKHVRFGAVDVLDVDGVAEAQAVAAAGDLTLNGALVVAGVAIFDVPRAVENDSSSTDTTQTARVYGTDDFGVEMAEDIAFNGTTAVAGLKAFKTVTRVAIDILLAGNATCGTTDVLGLPNKLLALDKIVTATDNGVVDAATIVVADETDPATAVTGDVRGTIDFAQAADGSALLSVLMEVVADTETDAYGLAQFTSA